MKYTRISMGMPITIEIVDEVSDEPFDAAYTLFRQIDAQYSPYKPDSELSRINAGLPESAWSIGMHEVFARCEETKRQTEGYFDMWQAGKRDPSGLVKGWVINQAAALLKSFGKQNFYIEAGGDIQVCGHNNKNELWTVGIRNPYNRNEIIKVVRITGEGIATSGTAARGQHIYNPHRRGQIIDDILSLTVIGPSIYDADRFATAAFAMGRAGITFIERLAGFEAYMIDTAKVATMTSGFEEYVYAA